MKANQTLFYRIVHRKLLSANNECSYCGRKLDDNGVCPKCG